MKKINTIIALMLIILLTSCVKVSIEKIEEGSFSDEILEVVDENNLVDFSKLNIDDWDTMYILRPYSSPEKILGATYNLIESNIEASDDINLIVFIRGKEVISYENVGRNKISFIKLDRDIYTKEDAIFYAKYPSNDPKILELNPVSKENKLKENK